MNLNLGRAIVGMGLLAAASAGCQNPLLTGDGTTTGGTSTSSGGPGTTTTTTTTATSIADTGTGTATTGASSGSESTGVPSFLFDVGGGVHSDLAQDDTTGGIVVDWDCRNLMQPFESETELVAPRGYHDVAFDDEGHIIGWDGNSFLKVSYADEVEVFVPGITSAQGMDVLGETHDVLYVNDFGELRRVTPDQQVSVAATGFNGAYGITVGPDQKAYVSTSGGVFRVDPDSGEATLWVALPSATPRALVFNLDSTGAYMSTLLEPGSPVFFVAVDDDLDPTDDPYIFANGVGQGYHDGLGIDACGNLYVPDFNTRGLYRVDPDGVVTTLYSTNLGAAPAHYGHGLEWGSGVDGWNHKAIYLPQPYDNHTVNEVVLGVPSGSYVRTWVGA